MSLIEVKIKIQKKSIILFGTTNLVVSLIEVNIEIQKNPSLYLGQRIPAHCEPDLSRY